MPATSIVAAARADPMILRILRFSRAQYEVNPRFPGCRLPKATVLHSSTPGKAERAGTWVGASREVAQTQLLGAAPRIWRVVSSSRSILVAPRLPGLSSFIALDPHAASGGGGRGRRSSIRRR